MRNLLIHNKTFGSCFLFSFDCNFFHVHVDTLEREGEWYLPSGFIQGKTEPEPDEPEDPLDSVEELDKRSLRLAFAALKAQSTNRLPYNFTNNNLHNLNNFYTDRLLMKSFTNFLLAPNESGELFGRKITKMAAARAIS
jgi:hypothetical protein